MVWEVEIKAWADESIEEKIKDLGAAFVEWSLYHDIYYEHPVRNFQKTDELIRLRHLDNGKGLLTYKGKSGDAKRTFKPEIETIVDHPKNTHLILEKIGFTPAIEKYKENRDYRYDDILITVTRLRYLGLFIEMEILTEKKENIAANRNKLYSLLEKLEIGKEKIETKYYTEMLTEKKKGLL